MIYSDTSSGAIECLKVESTYDTEGATASPDPMVKGVWLITLKSHEQVIIYLGGYKDPLGNIRPFNDFESI